MKISCRNAQWFTKNEVLQQHGNECKRHTEYCQEEVAEREVQQQDVGHCPHSLVLNQGQNDQDIAHHGHTKNQGVDRDDDIALSGQRRRRPFWSRVSRERTSVVVKSGHFRNTVIPDREVVKIQHRARCTIVYKFSKIHILSQCVE